MLIFILILGSIILFLLQRRIYRLFWNRGLSIKVKYKEESAFEGDRSSLTEVLENKSYLPLPFIHAKFQVSSGLFFDGVENVITSDRNYKNDIFTILFFQKITRNLPFTCYKRGYYPIHQADLVGSDLFYTSHMACSIPQHTSFYVYPKKLDVTQFEQPLKKMIGDMTSRQFIYPDPFEFRGLRTYTISDPMNTINWKASARAGELMVNMYDSTTTKKVVIFLNVEDETLLHYDPIHEEAIRIAACLSSSLLSQGYPVKLVLNGRDMETRNVPEAILANGPSQIEDMYRTLARIDLHLNPEEFYPLVERELENEDYEKAGYIMISASQKEPLQEAFRKIADAAAALWIAPLYKDMNYHLEMPEQVTAINWEVDGHA